MPLSRTTTHRTAWTVAALVGVCAASPVTGQGLAVPSAHFGALSFPHPDRIWEAGISLDRYTEHTKRVDSLDCSRMRHYALDKTLGFNFAHVSRSFHWREAATLFRAGVQLGHTGDQPTRFFQNNFRHNDDDLEFIGVEEAPERMHVGATLGMDKWFDLRLLEGEAFGLRWEHNAAAFLGMAWTESTVNRDVAVLGGVRMTRFAAGTTELPTMSVMFRKAVYVERGAAYPEGTIANTYLITAWSMRAPIDSWIHSSSLVPAVEIGWTNHSGFFLAKPSVGSLEPYGRIPEKFITLSLQWVGGDFAIETYNDTRGHKDLGPSYGARTYFRWRHWRWDK
jgi:hypothetical protein